MQPVFSQSIRQIFSDTRWAFALLVRKHPRLAAGITFVALAKSALQPAILIITKVLIDRVTPMIQSESIQITPLLPLLLTGGGLILLDSLLPAWGRYQNKQLRDKWTLTITEDYLRHAASLDISLFEDLEFQNMLQRTQGNVANQCLQFVIQTMNAFSALLKLTALIAILGHIETWSWVAFPLLGVFYIGVHTRLAVHRYNLEYSRATKRRWAKYFSSRLTSIPSVMEVKIFNLADRLIQKYTTLMQEILWQDQRLYRRQWWSSCSFVMLALITGGALLIRVGLRARDGLVTFGQVVIYWGAILQVRVALEKFVDAATQCVELALLVGDHRKFFAAHSVLPEGQTLLPEPVRGEIKFDNVFFTYPGSSCPALLDVSFTLHPGETLAVVGENGAGKSTLVKLLVRLYDPAQGRILLDGVDIKEIPLTRYYRCLSCLFQQFGRYEGTAAENIAYGDPDRLLQNSAAVLEVAQAAGVDELIQELPEGYETLVGKMFGKETLSGGQWQKLAIARAFASSAPILILDEPSSNLDPHSEARLVSRLQALATTRTTLLISHRLSTVRIANRILVMHEGRVAEQGQHDELMAHGGLYAALVDLVAGR